MSSRGKTINQAPDEGDAHPIESVPPASLETLDAGPSGVRLGRFLESGRGIPEQEPLGTALTLDPQTALGVADTLDGHHSPLPPISRPPPSDAAATLSFHRAVDATPLGLVESDVESAGSAPMELPPTLKERFISVQFLGQGGMGSVYKATDKRLGRDVAIKLLFGGGAEMTTQMLREARSQARLEHENACKVYEVGVADGHRYILMQLIHGETLDKAKVQMTLEQKVDVIRRVALALQEAHRMGLVHRDVKPSNIMVEQTEDGLYKPFIMDFGLARDVGADHTATRSGVIAGTPAFMSPEQALGKVRSLDRRTDVYSLGATLYDLLCDRPPFVDESVFRLLQRLTKEDVTPLSKVMPDIPRDLDAIVMKCLEKEPPRRYDSAKAFSDDLQRFLDGEPVTARHASLSYIAVKKLRRHKGKAALMGVALLAGLVFAFAWFRQQRLAAAREVLARELGENIKEMELLMRHAYSLPLHDIERERAMVRTELEHIETRMNEAGPAAEGPGHYALGRGYAVLEQRDRALEHLRKAQAAGYSPPELDYAMGLLLGDLYKAALEETKRIENAEKKKARIEAVEAEYKAPALKHLKAALGAKLEAPAYVEGLIALYEGRNDEAKRLANEAFAKIPWLYEAKKLEGDAFFAEGSKYRHDAAFDYEKMTGLFEQAAKAYEESSAIARSNPGVYEAACELWIQVMFASHLKPEALKPNFERANASCNSAVIANPNAGAPRNKTAFAYITFAWQMINWQPGSQEIEELLENAIARGEDAAQTASNDPMAHYVSAAASRNKILYQYDRGLDANQAIEKAIAAYNKSIELDPTLLWAHNELCSTYVFSATQEIWKGKDPSPSVNRGVAVCRKAADLDPTFLYTYINHALSYTRMAIYQTEIGQSPMQAIQDALRILAPAIAQSPNSPGPLDIATITYLLQAGYEDRAGNDTSATLALAEKNINELKKIIPDTQMVRGHEGNVALLKATRLVREERDPEPFLGNAKKMFELASKESPWDVYYLNLLTRTHILGIRWALHQKKANIAMFDEAFSLLTPLLDRERVFPDLYQALAELYFLKASWLVSDLKPHAEELKQGLAMANKALHINPGMATAFLVKGRLLALQAQEEKEARVRGDLALQAKVALDAAVKENALLKIEVLGELDKVEKLSPQANSN